MDVAEKKNESARIRADNGYNGTADTICRKRLKFKTWYECVIVMFKNKSVKILLFINILVDTHTHSFNTKRAAVVFKQLLNRYLTKRWILRHKLQNLTYLTLFIWKHPLGEYQINDS